MSVPFGPYYSTYHGHKVEYLRQLLTKFEEFQSENNPKQYIYFAGDSSLDNKYWIDDNGKATNGYELILNPPVMKKDVCYHLNNLLNTKKLNYIAINTSVEATTLAQRGISIIF
jgi:hypothetical protein